MRERDSKRTTKKCQQVMEDQRKKPKGERIEEKNGENGKHYLRISLILSLLLLAYINTYVT